MKDVFICDAVRTPIGRYGGALSAVRADDLAALPVSELLKRNASLNPEFIDDVVLGCANQSGEDNRNVARMAALLAGLPVTVAGSTINRLCGSGLNAVGIAANSIRSDEADIVIAGGVESMSRAPFVMSKSNSAFDRSAQMYDTTMGWRFINQKMEQLYGVDSMPQTAQNLSEKFSISREDQDAFAFWSQSKTAAAQKQGRFIDETVSVSVTKRKGQETVVVRDEHPRPTQKDILAGLRPILPGSSITAGNSSGLNDGAAALLLASEVGLAQQNLTPKARVLGMAVAGVEPEFMGIGPVPATQKLLARLKLTMDDMDIIELNEAFAAQALACTRQLGLNDDDSRVNPQGGAIALGHPLGMSGARLITTAMYQLHNTNKQRALCAMCIGVGQGIAMVIERT
ncbi:MAG: 3-oxoadipyl-CoA thiolase [Arenicella sp.]